MWKVFPMDWVSEAVSEAATVVAFWALERVSDGVSDAV